MGWDEALFGYFLKKISRRREDPAAAGRVTLDEVAPRLRLLSAALTGESLRISAAEGAGGYDGDRLFLPAELGLLPDRDGNRRAYLYRLLAALAARELRLTLPDGVAEDEARALELSLAAVPAVRAHVEARLPRAAELLAELGAALAPGFGNDAGAALADPGTRLALFGRLPRRSAAKERPAATAAAGPYTPESLSSGTEKKGKPRERAEEARLDEKKDDENPLVHVFEKVLTADEYGGGKKNLDGSDELEEHAEALEELNLRHVIRSREKARSIYKSDVMVDGGAPDLEDDGAPPAGRAVLYDEWDHSKRAYRRGWCTVFESAAPAAERDPASASSRNALGAAAGSAAPGSAATGSAATVKKLRAELEKLLNERRWRGRQLDGPEPDIDALVTRAADLRGGSAPSERVSLSRRRTHRDFAATILLDVSLSTDSWVGGQHVIQVAREAVLVLAGVLEGVTENVSVAAFSSNTRRDCRYLELKGFRERWPKLRERVPALNPTGYTRIGPAIRHATAGLARTGARKKLLLLISDGKPTDYDRYEGTYGIEDVRQSIREAQGAGLRVRALALDAEAKFYLPRMFGVGGYQILPHPGLLAPALSKIFVQCLT